MAPARQETKALITNDAIGLARALFEELGDALFLLDPETDALLDVNPVVMRLTGFTRAEILEFPATYLFRYEAAGGGMQRLQGAFTKTMVFHSQDGFLLRTKQDNNWIPVNLTVSRLHLPSKPLGLIIARDDRERRAALNQTRRAEAELRKVLASSPAALWSAERSPGPDVFAGWQFRYVSPLLSRIADRPNQFIDHPLKWIDVIHPADRDSYRAQLHRLLVGPSNEIETSYRVLTPTGSIRWVKDNLQVVRDSSGRPVRLDGCLNDITTQRQADDALRQSEQRFRALVERSRDGILLLDDKGAIKYVSPSVRHILGYDPLAWTGRLIAELLDPHDHGILRERLSSAKRRPGEDFPFMARAFAANGQERIIEFNLCNRLDDPSVRAVVINFRDVTEREQSARALASQHALLTGLFASLPEMVTYKDRDLRFLGGNPAFEAFAGRPINHLIGLKCEDVIPEEWARRVHERELKVLQTQKAEQVEETIVRPDGKRLVLDISITPLFASDGAVNGVILVARNVTERKMLEDQLRQSQKLEAVGQLAGGVAHDFNNLLTVILGNLELVRSQIPGLDTRELLAATEEAARQAAELTRQMLGFARRQPMRLEPLDLAKTANDTVTLLRRTIDPRVQISVGNQPDLWPVLADAGQIQQVLMNLCLNARDAMPDGGNLSIHLENVSLHSHPGRPITGDYVRLSVSDTGIGMSSEVRERMFEPFFTTKPLGQGTGLGLAVVFGIIQGHHGWIECDSEPGKGTRIDVFFPRAATGTNDSRDLSDVQAPLGHGETILLVDDELLVREVGKNILISLGYQVITAKDGHEAVAIYEREQSRIHLIIMDLMMPKLSGREAFAQICTLNPHARVLFASGQADAHSLPGSFEAEQRFLNKPYTPSTLAQAVRKALSTPLRSSPHAPASIGPHHTDTQPAEGTSSSTTW